MEDPDDELPRIELFGDSVEVTDLETGRRVDAPGVVAKGIGAMTEAVEAAGGTMDSSNVQVIKPGMITGYTPRDASFDLAIDYNLSLAEMLDHARFGSVDALVQGAAVSHESGVVEVTARLINLDRMIDGDAATNLLDVTGFRPMTLEELIAFATRYRDRLYKATIPALGTQLRGADNLARVAVLEIRDRLTRLTTEPFSSEWDRSCRFLAAAN